MAEKIIGILLSIWIYIAFGGLLIILLKDFPLMTLSQRMGHADASITLKHYGHFVKGLEVDVNDYIEKVS